MIQKLNKCYCGHTGGWVVKYRMNRKKETIYAGDYISCHVCGNSGPLKKTINSAIISWNKQNKVLQNMHEIYE
ncbi:MAG: hypothetical protein WC511_01735 [Candidatus Pacearchaeota archaeon]